jgi:TfoX/Sxy family transcriptional regulator of competence genes
MATTKEYRDFIVEQLHILEPITCRPMMGEYLLYYDNILFGGIYNNQLLIKRVEGNKKYNLPEVIPYKGAKAMYFIEESSFQDQLKNIILDTCKDLPPKKKKS